MNAPIGIGVLSFAHGHVQMYVDVMKEFPDVRLVAAYDDNAERAKPVCERVGMRYTPQVEEVLGDPNVQAVMIGSETNRHADLAVAAAQAGKHILVQKPMALSIADCDRMIAAAEKAKVSLAIGSPMRADPANIKMRELVQSGALGKICMVRRRHCIGVLLVDSFVNGLTRWHIEADKNMGMFMDDATHPADWFHWIFGKPVSVIAEIDNVITNVAPDDNGVAVFRFQGGAMGILLNSSTIMVSENTTEIYGEKGCIIQNYGDGPSCGVPHCPDGPPLKMFRYGAADWDVFPEIPSLRDHGIRIRAVPRPWVDSLIRETPPPATGQDGRVAVEMILGAYQSAHEGRRVTFA